MLKNIAKDMQLSKSRIQHIHRRIAFRLYRNDPDNIVHLHITSDSKIALRRAGFTSIEALSKLTINSPELAAIPRLRERSLERLFRSINYHMNHRRKVS